MANGYYNHGTWPASNSAGASAPARAELDAVTSGFGLLPNPLGSGQQGFNGGQWTNPIIIGQSGGGSIDAVPIGATTPSTGAFTSLGASGAVTFLGGGSLSGSYSGAPTFTGNVAFTSIDVNGGTIDNTPIGSSARSAGLFTTLGANGAVTFSAGGTLGGTFTGGTFTGGTIQNTPIGTVTPAAGNFTSLGATGAINFTGGGSIAGAVSFSTRPSFNGNTPWDSSNLPVAVDAAGDITVPGSIIQATQQGNLNFIVDGAMENSISASVTTSVGGSTNSCLAMFYNVAGTAGQATVSQNAFAAGAEPLGMSSPAIRYMKHAQTTATTGAPGTVGAAYIGQVLESAQTLQGRSATLSMWLWTDSGTITIPMVAAQQQFGTGGGPSAAVLTTKAVTWVITTTPQRFSVRLDIPSINGKTFGTNRNDSLGILLYLPNGSTFALNTTQWQIEKSQSTSSSNTTGTGGAPTPFEYRGAAVEQTRVARFYRATTMAANSIAGLAIAVSSSQAVVNVPLKTSDMRNSVPTLSLAGNTAVTLTGPGGGGSSLTLSGFFADAVFASIAAAGTLTASAGYIWGPTAAGALTIVADARL